ncbi:MAG TPA: hypothetical protein VG406_23015 [Isosphaeraceae bacterium]|nr:hypothetical protein [Isosphaeraceae bacterium]
MQRFADGRYSRHIHHGGMLGYVLDGDIERAVKNVLSNIRANASSLGMDAPGGWDSSPFRPDDGHAKQSVHRRVHTGVRFQLQHQFVSGAGRTTTQGVSGTEGEEYDRDG